MYTVLHEERQMCEKHWTEWTKLCSGIILSGGWGGGEVEVEVEHFVALLDENGTGNAVAYIFGRLEHD